MFLQVILFFVCVFCVVYFLFKRRYQYFKNRDIPQIEPVIFPFGNWSDQIYGKKCEGVLLGDFYKNYKNHPLIGVFQFNIPTIIINHPEIIKQVLIREFNSFVDRGIEVNENIDPIAGNIFFLQGAKWRNLRNKLSPTFTSGKIKQMLPIIEKQTNNLSKYLEQFNGEEIEMKEPLARLLIDIISECAFGIESNCIENPNSEFRKWGKKALEMNFRTVVIMWLTMIAKPIRNFLNIKMFNPKMQEFFINIVNETIKYREKNNIKINDFMQMLIQLKNNEKIMDDENNDNKIKEDDGKALTIEQCAAQAFAFFVAGYETSSSTISHALYELARNPDIQIKTQEEIDKVFEKNNNKFTYESLLELHYLEKVINETLRKFPPAPLLNRQVTNPVDLKLDNETKSIHLEKDLKVLIPIYGLHYDPEYFPNPERFDPERFNEENISKRPKMVYLPFGEGPRNCIGARFGMIQTKLGLAILLRNYNFVMSENTPLKLTYNAFAILLETNEPLKFRIERRFKK